MATVTKIINFIVAVPAGGAGQHIHRSASSLSSEMAGFISCFDAIKAFLAEKDQKYPELEDKNWIGL